MLSTNPASTCVHGVNTYLQYRAEVDCIFIGSDSISLIASKADAIMLAAIMKFWLALAFLTALVILINFD